MMTDLTILQVSERLDIGDGVHRFHAPARAMGRLPGVTIIECDVLHQAFGALAERVDVLVLAAFNGELLPLFERRRRAGLLTVVEANDDYTDLQPWNPFYARWLDRTLQDSFFSALRLADGIQTSTPHLADRWRGLTSAPIAVFRNHLEAVPPLAAPPPRPLTIGWGGSPGHFADWYAVAPVLQRWLEVHPEVHLAVMANEYAHPFLQLPPERYHTYPFGSLECYLDFLSTLDIGLAPLLPSAYNRGRSDVKMLEYASRGVAGIYRDLEPYQGSVVHGETGLLYRTDDELVACLDFLVHDAELRRHIRERAHAYVVRERRLEEQVVERLAFYRALGAVMHGNLDETPALVQVLAAGQSDGGHIQLWGGAAEQGLRRLRQGGVCPEVEQGLVALTVREPGYLLAWQDLAQVCNELGKPDAALEAARRAEALDATRVRTQTEAARALYRLGDVAAARDLLRATVESNPRFAPGWQLLFALGARHGLGGAAELAARARTYLPRNLSLALAATPMLSPEERPRWLLDLLESCDIEPDAEAPWTLQLTQMLGGLFDLEEGGSERVEEAGEAVAAGEGWKALWAGVLCRACERFPTAEGLARLYARVLEGLYPAKAAQERERAEQLVRDRAVFHAEMGEPDGRLHIWQISEHILSVRDLLSP